MKITRRPPPLDFGASNDDALRSPATEAAADEASTPEAEPEAPSATIEAATAPVASSATPRRATAVAEAWPLYLTAFAVAVLWALGPIAFAVGYRSGVAPLQNDRFALIVFGLLAVGPAALVFGAAFILRQGQKLAAEARRTRELEQVLLAPALRAAADAGEVTRAVREQIASVAGRL